MLNILLRSFAPAQNFKTEMFTYRSKMRASAEAVYRFQTEPGALERRTPPWEKLPVVARTGRTRRRSTQSNVSRHHAHWPVPPLGEHTHKFIPENEHFSWLEDTVEYEFPLGKLGEFLAVPTPTAAFSACSNGATELPPNNSLPGLPTLTCISEVRGNSIDPAFVLLRSTHRMPHDNIQTFLHGVQHFSIF